MTPHLILTSICVKWLYVMLHANILLLLLGGSQGLLLCILLLRKKAYRKGYGFLVLYLVVMIAQVVFKVADKYWLMQHAPFTYNASYYFPFLYGPLAWFFARSFIARKEQFAFRDGLHFLPFLLSCIIYVTEGAYASFRLLYLLFGGWSGMFVQLALLGWYHYRAMKLCGTAGAEVAGRRLQWLRRFILHSWWICSVITCLIVLIYTTYPQWMQLRFGFVLLTVFIYWVSYCAIAQPQLFMLASAYYNGEDVPSQALLRPERKYVNSPLKEPEATRIVGSLQALMQEKRIYTDPELTIEKLTAHLKTNRHTLSQVLNERMGLSFFDYINGLRVEEAKRLLKNAARQHHKIAAVAHDAGFNSLSVFNDVFKKLTGQTPSEFRRAAQNNVPVLRE